MTQENKTDVVHETHHAAENLKSVGQILLGEIEKIGGILTGDPITQAEGDYNLEAGALHQQANKNLTAIDRREESEKEEI